MRVFIVLVEFVIKKNNENYLVPFQKQGDMKNRSDLSLQTSFGEYVYCNACMTI